jgi:hypothetical protein
MRRATINAILLASTAENVTVIRGTFKVGMGATIAPGSPPVTTRERALAPRP